MEAEGQVRQLQPRHEIRLPTPGGSSGGREMCLDSGCVCCRRSSWDCPRGLDVCVGERKESRVTPRFWS